MSCFVLLPQVNPEEGNTTPLHAAARTGREAVVRLLLQAGAAVDQARDDGWTPLYVAAQNGHEVVVRQLLAAGADRARRMVAGDTAADVAQRNGHPEVAAMLRPYFWGLFG